MKSWCFWIAVCLGFAAHGISAGPLKLYVATNGNDGWSGSLPQPSRDRKDGPLASLTAALKAARLARQNTAAARDGIAIYLRGGTYYLDEPLVFRPEDSGIDPEKPLLVAAYRREKPVLSGGRPITGWRRVNPKAAFWEVAIPEVRQGHWHFRQLFVKGRRQLRSRIPNQGFYRIQGPSPQDQPVKIHFKPGEIKKEWAADGDVELIALLAWADVRMQIREVDTVNHVAVLSGNPRPSNKENNAQYYIENAPDGVDQPGEWYLNRKTGLLSFWAPADTDMTRAEVIAPRLEELVVFQGDLAAKKPVRHVRLRGLAFCHTDWMLGPSGHADTQAAIAVRGDIRAEAAVDCVIEDCMLGQLGGYGIELGRGCQRFKIIGNQIADMAAGGIRLGEPVIRTDAFDQNYGHTITQNHIHHVGEVYPPAVGILVLQSGTNRVAHNHIHHLYYTAISVGWTWGYRESPCRNHIIEFNHLHDIGQHRLSDMGAVYTLGPQPGTVIRNNLIHDVESFTYGGWGLYTDEGSSGIVLENNIVYRTKSAGFHQHYGRENIIRNNVFTFGKEYQVMRTRAEAHVSFIFTNNIVYFDSGEILGGNWSNDNFVMDRNVYFDARPGATPDSLRFARESFETWRNRGHDRHSRLADPLFVAPQKADFRLRQHSPAHRLGFKPIDLRDVGARKRNAR